MKTLANLRETAPAAVAHLNDLIDFKSTGAGSVARRLAAKLADFGVSVLDFIPVAEHAAIRAHTSTTDCRAWIQAAIDYAIYGGGGGTVYMPAGRYCISGPLHLGYGTTYTRCTLEGAGGGYRGEAQFGGTTILCQYSNAPGIVIQGGRRAAIRNLAVVGQNANHIGLAGHGFYPSFRDVDLAVWVDPALHANANSRYAPYAGIAVDPYSGARPETSYPDVAYPAEYVGSPAQYGKNFTDVAVIEDCYIGGFVVGLVVQPGAADGNGDHISARNCKFENLAYGVSLGNSQGRSTNMDNCQFFGIHTCFTNYKHGKLRGKFGGVIRGCSFNGCIQLVDINPGYNGAFPMDGCYGELIWRIGDMGGNTSTNAPLVLRDCEFSLQNAAYGGGVSLRGLPQNVANVPTNSLVIDAGKYSMMTIFNVGGQCEFRGGPYIHADMIDNIYPATVTDDLISLFGSTLGVMGEHTTAPRIKRHSTLAWGGGDQYNITARVLGDIFPATLGTRAYPMPPTTREVQYSSGPSAGGLPVGAPVYHWNKSDLAIEASDPIAVTVDFGSLAAAYLPYGVSKGDTIADSVSGTIFLITSAVGTVATCKALNNYYTEAGVRHYQSGPLDEEAGSLAVTVNRVFTCRNPILADLTAGSATAANVGRADTYFASNEIAAGDFPLVNDYLFRPFGAGTTVAAIDTNERTIQFSSAANYTQPRVPLLYWVRAPL